MKYMAVSVLVLAIFVSAALFFFCTAIVPLDRVGVRSNLLGEGVQQEDLKPGLWLVIPGVHKLDILDPTLQRLNYAGDLPQPKKTRRSQFSDNETESMYGNTESALMIRTKDQYMTALDVTIFYRIKEGQAHKVLVKLGSGYKFRDTFRLQAGGEIWKVMSDMRTEDFYDSKARRAKADESVARLNKVLEEGNRPLEVTSLLIRKVVFDERFEAQLINKQLYDQRKLLDESLTSLEKEKEKTERIMRETEAKVLAIDTEKKEEIVTLSTQGQAKIARIKADADYQVRELITEAERYKRENIAEGEKLKELATAIGEKAINEAYQSSGGNLVLSRKMIQNLDIGEIIINTNKTNPFDVKQFLKMIGAESK